MSLLAPLLLAGAAHAAAPVAIWDMHDPTSMADSSGNNNNSTAMAGISAVAGSSGQGYHFASNGSVTVRNSDSLNPGTEDFTITMHVNFGVAPAAGLDYDLIRKGLSTTTGGEWKMEIFGNSTLSSPAFCLFKGAASAAVTVRGTTNLAGTGWHTITCQKTSTQVSVYVDGSQQRVNKTVVGAISNTADVSLGRKLGGGDQYVGDMDEVTIQKGPASPPDTPPTLTGQTPAPNATGVAVGDSVTATFNEPVNSVSGSTFTLTPPAGGSPVPASVGPGPGSNQWVLDPSDPLAEGATYTATLTSGITDSGGNPFAGASWTFTTAAPPGDTTPPTVATTSPANTATGVAVDSNVTATFSESVQGVGGTTFKLKVTATGAAVPAGVAYDDLSHTATLDPVDPLAPNTKYTARLIGGASAIRDAAGNPLTTTPWTFTTGAGAGGGGDVTPPTVTAHTPTGATGISRTANVTATFSEPVTNVTTLTFTLTPAGGGAAVTAQVTFNSTSGKWVLNPADTLGSKTQYTATVVGGSNGVKDMAGNPLLADVTWTFTTAL